MVLSLSDLPKPANIYLAKIFLWYIDRAIVRKETIYKTPDIARQPNMPKTLHLLLASRCAQTILKQRLALASAATASGWKVTVAGIANRSEDVDSLVKMGYSFEALPVDQKSLSLFKLLDLLQRAFQVCWQTRPDIFHAFTVKPIIAGLPAAWLAGVPVRVATIPGLGHAFLTDSRFLRFVTTILYKLALLFASRVYFYNQSDLAHFLSARILPPSKAFLISGSGLDTSQWKIKEPVVREKLVILYIGRLIAEKGVRELLKATRLALARGGAIELHMVGDIDPNNPSSLTLSELNQFIDGHSIIWHGQKNNILPFMKNANIVVLPSYREGIPLSLLEGGASGRALVASDVPGCADVVRHGETGLLVNVGDIEGLANAFLELAGDRERVAVMGRKARCDVIRRFDSDVVNSQMIRDYKELITTYVES